MEPSTKRQADTDCFVVSVKTRFSSVGASVVRLFRLGNQLLCYRLAPSQDPEPTP